MPKALEGKTVRTTTDPTFGAFDKEATAGASLDKNPSPTDATLRHSVASMDLAQTITGWLYRLRLFSTIQHLNRGVNAGTRPEHGT